MANIGIVSAAYFGDVMPFVPIAEELTQRGHDVTLAVPEGFHEALRDGPYDLVHLGTDFSPRELADHGAVLDRADSPLGVRAAAELWVEHFCVDRAEHILAVLDGLAPDVWLVHPSLYWLVEMAAAADSTPVVVGHLFPMMIPSAHQGPPMLPGGGSSAVNRVGWRVGRAMAGRMMYDGAINELRAARGLAPAAGNVGFGWERAQRTLLLTSPHYWPRPPDWSNDITMTGFTIWDGSSATVPEDLLAWLEDGPPPVLVTFGTSAASNAKDAFTLVAEATEELGQRPLLLVGNERNRIALGGRPDVWTFAPLPAVLTRCRAVVHAGGHGTTAAALHAGVPQLAMPQAFDQVGHAKRMTELGVGTKLAFKRRSPRRLRTALAPLLDGAHDRHATDLAKVLANEDGPATAAGQLEELL